MKKINRYQVEPIKDPCGLIRELYSSKNISIAHDEVIGDAEIHMHKNMEEIYYVEEGKGRLLVGNEIFEIEQGDLIPIPKNTWHQLKKIENHPLEVLVITHPKYDSNDLILKNP